MLWEASARKRTSTNFTLGLSRTLRIPCISKWIQNLNQSAQISCLKWYTNRFKKEKSCSLSCQCSHGIPCWEQNRLGLKCLQDIVGYKSLVNNNLKYKFFEPVGGHAQVAFLMAILTPRVFHTPFCGALGVLQWKDTLYDYSAWSYIEETHAEKNVYHSALGVPFTSSIVTPVKSMAWFMAESP